MGRNVVVVVFVVVVVVVVVVVLFSPSTCGYNTGSFLPPFVVLAVYPLAHPWCYHQRDASVYTYGSFQKVC